MRSSDSSEGAQPAGSSQQAVSRSFLDESLGGFLDRIAAAQPAPGGGAAAAIAVAAAAALVSMAARFSAQQLDEAGDLVARAEALRARSASLAQEDADAYGRVVACLRMPRERDPVGRQEAIRAALSAAADVPLVLAEVAAEVAALGARVAEEGNTRLRGDAVAASLLADAGARTAAALVAVNLEAADDPRVRRAAELASTAAEAARGALAAGS